MPSNMEKKQWLEEIMNQYGEEMTRIAYLYVKDWENAKDAVQETFYKCFLKKDTYRGESSLKTWVYRILFNTCQDTLRKKKSLKSFLFSEKFQTKKSQSPEQNLLINEEKYYIADLVLSLPIKYRDCIILYYYKDFSIKQISTILNQKETTIKVRLSRGREKLKKKLEEGGLYSG